MTKINKIARAVSLLIMIVAMIGCGIGYNKTLFFTKTNVGLDIDSRPPTAEVTIARREGVISPTFEGGQTPPVLASFTVDVKGISSLFAGISSTFAGGDAAVTMAMLYDDSDEDVAGKYTCADFDSSFDLTQEPNYLDWFGNPDQSKNLLKKGEIEPFIFGTDTSFGLKVAWSGVTAQVPDTVKLGFNRKEFALAPVTSTPIPNTPDSKVRMPSFLATIDNSTKLGSMEDSEIQHLQYFATGKAADFMARRYAVRKAMMSRLEPVAAQEFTEYKGKYHETENSEKIRIWREAEDNPELQKERSDNLNDWLEKYSEREANGDTLDITTWLTRGRASEYEQAIKYLKIP